MKEVPLRALVSQDRVIVVRGDDELRLVTTAVMMQKIDYYFRLTMALEWSSTRDHFRVSHACV